MPRRKSAGRPSSALLRSITAFRRSLPTFARCERPSAASVQRVEAPARPLGAGAGGELGTQRAAGGLHGKCLGRRARSLPAARAIGHAACRNPLSARRRGARASSRRGDRRKSVTKKARISSRPRHAARSTSARPPASTVSTRSVSSVERPGERLRARELVDGSEQRVHLGGRRGDLRRRRLPLADVERARGLLRIRRRLAQLRDEPAPRLAGVRHRRGRALERLRERPEALPSALGLVEQLAQALGQRLRPSARAFPRCARAR